MLRDLELPFDEVESVLSPPADACLLSSGLNVCERRLVERRPLAACVAGASFCSRSHLVYRVLLKRWVSKRGAKLQQQEEVRPAKWAAPGTEDRIPSLLHSRSLVKESRVTMLAACARDGNIDSRQNSRAAHLSASAVGYRRSKSLLLAFSLSPSCKTSQSQSCFYSQQLCPLEPEADHLPTCHHSSPAVGQAFFMSSPAHSFDETLRAQLSIRGLFAAAPCWCLSAPLLGPASCGRPRLWAPCRASCVTCMSSGSRPLVAATKVSSSRLCHSRRTRRPPSSSRPPRLGRPSSPSSRARRTSSSSRARASRSYGVKPTCNTSHGAPRGVRGKLVNGRHSGEKSEPELRAWRSGCESELWCEGKGNSHDRGSVSHAGVRRVRLPEGSGCACAMHDAAYWCGQQGPHEVQHVADELELDLAVQRGGTVQRRARVHLHTDSEINT
jgi:hypothetical protein